MSSLSLAIERLLQSRGWTQQRLAEVAGIHPSILTRTMRGHSRMDDDNFCAVVEALTADPLEQAECVAARLCDYKRGPGCELVEIRVRGIDALQDAPRGIRTHAAMLERAELYLHELARQRTDVADLVIDLAECFGLSLQKPSRK